MFQKIKDIIDTIRFNFHYLPFKQAIKLPIYVHNARFDSMLGRVKIDADKIYRGMITLGVYGVPLFPNTGFCWQNHGGEVVFKGKFTCGTGGGISVNKVAKLTFGNDIFNSYGLKIIASRNISIGEGTRFAWNVFIMDTNMHPLKNKLTGKKSSGGAPIQIGDYNWFGTNAIILPGVVTPERVICGLGSIVTRNISWESWCLYGGNPLHKLKDNIYRDNNDDRDEYVYG